LAEAAKLTQEQKIENIQFVFCGNGAGRADLEQACLGLKNVIFFRLATIGALR
jgi:colanic acid biosynthesis glycosyl transferase WcaI